MLQDLSLGCESHSRQADLVPLSGPPPPKKKKKNKNKNKTKKSKSFQRQESNPGTPEM